MKQRTDKKRKVVNDYINEARRLEMSDKLIGRKLIGMGFPVEYIKEVFKENNSITKYSNYERRIKKNRQKKKPQTKANNH